MTKTMHKPRVLMLYSHGGEVVTGGQKYEDDLLRLWEKEMPDVTFERRYLNNKLSRWGKYLTPLRNLRLLRQVKDYDLVIFNSAQALYFTPLALALRWFTKAETMAIHHHFMYYEKRGIKRAYYKGLETGFLRALRRLVVVSPFMEDVCSRMFRRKKRYYWQIPFNTDLPVTTDPAPGHLLYIGTIEPRKGLHHLVDAMTMLKKQGKELRLTIIGKTVDNEYRRRLDETILDNALDVRFTGFLTHAEKADIEASADIFAFPSRCEGYGMVICESMAKGLPVVAFDNSAMPYTVHDEQNGLLVADGDTRQFAFAIDRITADRTLRDRLARGALDTAKTFMTPERFGQTVTRDLRDILS